MKKIVCLLGIILLAAIARADLLYTLTSSYCDNNVPTTAYLHGTWTNNPSGCQIIGTYGFSGYHCVAGAPDSVSNDCQGTRCYFIVTLLHDRYASSGCPPGTIYGGAYTYNRICD
jgi:hypothetical protein